MEEIIDFDEWIKNYVPPEVEYYAIYDPESLVVVGVYPSSAANEKHYKIKIDRELAEDIQNGIVKMNSCFVDLDLECVEILETNALRKIDDIVHRIVDKKYSDIENPDILISYQTETNSLIFQMTGVLKKRKIKWNEYEDLNFFITDYNDPHILYDIVSIKLIDLYQENYIHTCADTLNKKFSIYTRRVFKNYLFENL